MSWPKSSSFFVEKLWSEIRDFNGGCLTSNICHIHVKFYDISQSKSYCQSYSYLAVTSKQKNIVNIGARLLPETYKKIKFNKTLTTSSSSWERENVCENFLSELFSSSHWKSRRQRTWLKSTMNVNKKNPNKKLPLGTIFAVV